MEWQTNIQKIELRMLLNAILKDFDSFKAEIEKRRTEIEKEFDYFLPMTPTQCMNSPN